MLLRVLLAQRLVGVCARLMLLYCGVASCGILSSTVVGWRLRWERETEVGARDRGERETEVIEGESGKYAIKTRSE